MSEEEIMACVGEAERYDYGTVVLQWGEDYGIETKWFANLIRRIKGETQLAVKKGIRVVDVDDIKHGDILKVTKHTTSDRTRQLLEAAYCAGKIAGAYLLPRHSKRKTRSENT